MSTKEPYMIIDLSTNKVILLTTTPHPIPLNNYFRYIEIDRPYAVYFTRPAHRYLYRSDILGHSTVSNKIVLGKPVIVRKLRLDELIM